MRQCYSEPMKPYLKSLTINRRTDSANLFPFSIPSLRMLDYLEFHPDVTFLIGENGAGKSTLIEAIAEVIGVGGLGGTGNQMLKDEFGDSGLSQFIKCQRSAYKPKDKYFLRAESFYNIAHNLEEMAKDPDARTTREIAFGRYGGQSLNLKSHGEAFLTVISKTFAGMGLYIMDEPEAALSPTRQLSALIRINELVEKESQFVIATHSPILLSYPRAWIYRLDDSGCNRVNYEDTEHYGVTLDFLKNYPKRLADLFNDADSDDTDTVGGARV